VESSSSQPAYVALTGDAAAMDEDDQMELLRQRVFEQLWREGFYVGAGTYKIIIYYLLLESVSLNSLLILL
tara:strand:+ start:451 stop:663 length:213 start_codon:yes stop_codon:yes gene_type:complete